jgi:hypothetical protein
MEKRLLNTIGTRAFLSLLSRIQCCTGCHSYCVSNGAVIVTMCDKCLDCKRFHEDGLLIASL